MSAEAVARDTPFREAIDYYNGKVRLPTRHYTDLMEAAHAKAFVVAGAMQDDLLAGLQEAVRKGLEQGTTLAEFRKDFDRLVAAHGWSYKGSRGWRTRTIFQTNVRTAYMAGKWEQAQRTRARRPYARYVATLDSKTRQEHRIWHGKVVPLDDPWWSTHWPPNGWGCRCSAQTVSDRELEANGWAVWNPPPDEWRTVTLQTPEGLKEVRTVAGVDPGWAYNPGKAATGAQLPESTVRASRDDGSWGKWRRLTPGDWRTAGRPKDVPVDASTARLAKKTDSADEMATIVRKVLGGEEKTFDTPGGSVLLTVAGVAGHVAPGRSPWVPFIPEILADPFEVWMTLDEHEVTGRVELRKRFIKRVQAGTRGQSLYLVANVVKGAFVGWTLVPASTPGVLNNQRVGKLLWARGEVD